MELMEIFQLRFTTLSNGVAGGVLANSTTALDLPTVLFAAALLWLAWFNIMLVRHAQRRLTHSQGLAAILIVTGLFGLWLMAALHFVLGPGE